MVDSLSDVMTEVSGCASDSVMPEPSNSERFSKSLRIPIVLGTSVLVSLVCLASATWQHHPRIAEGESLQLFTFTDWGSICGWLCDKYSYAEEPGYLEGAVSGIAGDKLFGDLYPAQLYCAINSKCNGVTCSSGYCRLKSGKEVNTQTKFYKGKRVQSKTWKKSRQQDYQSTRSWKAYPRTYMGGFPGGLGGHGFQGSLETMKRACGKNTECGGVTCKGDKCTLRKKSSATKVTSLKVSPTGETTYIYQWG